MIAHEEDNGLCEGPNDYKCFQGNLSFILLRFLTEISYQWLKALFNNVFTFKNLSCMTLHAISVFDVLNEALKKFVFQKHH